MLSRVLDIALIRDLPVVDLLRRSLHVIVYVMLLEYSLYCVIVLSWYCVIVIIIIIIIWIIIIIINTYRSNQVYTYHRLPVSKKPSHS